MREKIELVANLLRGEINTQAKSEREIHKENLKYLSVHTYAQSKVVKKLYWDFFARTEDPEKAKQLTAEKLQDDKIVTFSREKFRESLIK
jgi:hypothetical protein